jgi:hypothetical protein
MHERGMIDFGREKTQFRLIEPISLNDEFDTWQFDNFHGLFDLLMTRLNSKLFPVRWKFIDNAPITVQILNSYSSAEDNGDTRKTIQRPSTKSLEKFIEGICEIEDNGMASEWITSLRKEDITTYAHLTNLSLKDWERIKKLTMNALKTIKTYVDREKQTAEDQTTTQKSNENSVKTGKSMYLSFYRSTIMASSIILFCQHLSKFILLSFCNRLCQINGNKW